MKKSFLFLATSLALSLISCSPPSDIVIDTSEEASEEGATTIKMWMMDFEEWENRINIAQRKDFNSDTTDGIQLSQTYIDSNSFDDLIRSAYESNNVPDIYMVSYGNLYKEINAGRAIDITSYIDDSVWSDLTDNAYEAVTYGDKHYAFPIVMEPSTLVAYRKDLLSQYGEGATEIPDTWEDFLTLCGTLRTNLRADNLRNVYPFGVPTGVACAWGTWGMQYAATGGLAIDDTWSTSRITEPGYRQLAELWASLYTNGYVPLSSGDYTEAALDICAGKSVMTTCGSWSIASIKNQYPDLVDSIGFSELPTFTGEHELPNATNGGWCYVVSSECQNVDKAISVIKYLVAGDTTVPANWFRQAYYSKNSPRKSVQEILTAELATQTEVPSEWITTMIDVSNKAILEPIYDWNISVAVEGLLEEAAMGNDIDASVTKCDTTVKNLIISGGLPGTNPRNQ